LSDTSCSNLSLGAITYRPRRRHALVTELAESGAGDEVIMSIAGHVSRAMLSRYSHVRVEAKLRTLDEIAARQGAADILELVPVIGAPTRILFSLRQIRRQS
jgi:hypothetical protein